jgi:hypothetical protein
VTQHVEDCLILDNPAKFDLDWKKDFGEFGGLLQFGCVKNLFVIGDQNNNNNNNFGFDSGFGKLEENWRS